MPRMRFFKIPEDSRIRQQWIDFLKVERLKKRMFACMLHFEEILWIKPRLGVEDLPTKNRPAPGKYLALFISKSTFQ